jgi:hypothetical protein
MLSRENTPTSKKSTTPDSNAADPLLPCGAAEDLHSNAPEGHASRGGWTKWGTSQR